jgi:hypothetical protein
MAKKIRYGKAEFIEKHIEGNPIGFSGVVRIIKFNRRYYTVYGRSFAVAGKNVPYKEALKKRHYIFMDWNSLTNMAAE